MPKLMTNEEKFYNHITASRRADKPNCSLTRGHKGNCDELGDTRTCCDFCWNSKFAIRSKSGCGLTCECHLNKAPMTETHGIAGIGDGHEYRAGGSVKVVTETHSLGDWEKKLQPDFSDVDPESSVHVISQEAVKRYWERIRPLIDSLLLAQKEGFRREIEYMKNGVKHTHMGGCFDCSKDEVLNKLLTKLDTNGI